MTKSLDREAVVVYLTTTLLLVTFELVGKPQAFVGLGLEQPLAALLGPAYAPYRSLLSVQYWGMASLLLRTIIPVVVIVLLREQPSAFGFTLRGQRTTVKPYALALAAMLPVLFMAAALPSFQRKYPLFRDAAQGGWYFWGYQLFYGLQFLGLEAFFRGFALFGLARHIGVHAVPVMTIPYVMVHFGKPVPEVFAAIVAGLVLGTWALRSGSFLWGWLLHWTVALSMDLFVMTRQLGLGAVVHRLFW